MMREMCPEIYLMANQSSYLFLQSYMDNLIYVKKFSEDQIEGCYMGFFYYGKTRPKIHSPKMNKFYLNTDITTSMEI
jgi:hypothetical protein